MSENLEKERERIIRLLNESSDKELSDTDDVSSDDFVEPSEHETETEEEADISEDELPIENNNLLLGKDSTTTWSKKEPRPNVRTPKRNIISEKPGFKGRKDSIKSPIDCFRLFFDREVINTITACTNLQIQKVGANYSRARDTRPTDEVEIECFIGLLLFAGTNRSGRQNIKDLWDRDGLGVEIFYASMNYQRFRFLLQCLRFDDINSRAQRKTMDKLAPIRQLFEMLVRKFQDNYVMSEYTTVDEQLVGFRGRCSFRQYLPNKPARYGIKIFALVDSNVFYTYNLDVYAGSQPEGPYKVDNTPKEVVPPQ
ncbi:uncharacterized protein LOC124161483 [Ischnura elegans]|uniref:uncharacterized protein LOC124161483 n=1 Tax=Ischnura elegans TaxID=197161 RepID=UPI001ED8997D|nr:uncharacterized protein LOC124161483 [Ischnura elegans]